MTTDSPEISEEAATAAAFEAEREGLLSHFGCNDECSKRAYEIEALTNVLAAAYPHLVGPLLERLDQAERERDEAGIKWGEHYNAALAAAQARAEAADRWINEAAMALESATKISERMYRTGQVEGLNLGNHDRLIREATAMLAGDAARPQPQERPRCLTPSGCADDEYPCMVHVAAHMWRSDQ